MIGGLDRQGPNPASQISCFVHGFDHNDGRSAWACSMTGLSVLTPIYSRLRAS